MLEVFIYYFLVIIKYISKINKIKKLNVFIEWNYNQFDYKDKSGAAL